MSADADGGAGPPAAAEVTGRRQRAAGGQPPRPHGRRFSGLATDPLPDEPDRPAGGPASLGPVWAGRGRGRAGESPRLFVADATAVVLDWARRRQLGAGSATGIALALAGIAATWLSAGHAGALRGAVALWGSYLVLAAGRSLAREPAEFAAPPAGGAAAVPGRWLTALGLSLVQAAAIAGLVLGAHTAARPAPWTLGTALLGLVTARAVMTACSVPPGFAALPPGTPAGRAAAAAVTMAPGGQLLVIGVVTPVWGARTALLVLLGWAIASLAYGLAGQAAPLAASDASRTRPTALIRRLRDDGALARRLGALVQGKLVPLPPALLGLAAVTALAVVGLHDLSAPLFVGPAVVLLLAAPGSASPHAGRADWLLPVLLAGAQVLFLQAVGAGAPVPGPVTFVAVAALALRYADLCCAYRPVLLAMPRRGARPSREHGSELGWEGRVLAAGLFAAAGLALPGYLALAAWLVLLTGAKLVRSCLAEPASELSAGPA